MSKNDDIYVVPDEFSDEYSDNNNNILPASIKDNNSIIDDP